MTKYSFLYGSGIAVEVDQSDDASAADFARATGAHQWGESEVFIPDPARAIFNQVFDAPDLTPAPPTLSQAYREAAEQVEGISGGDYILTAFALVRANEGRCPAETEAVADHAAIITEDIHRMVIAFRQAGLPASFLAVQAAYVPLVRWGWGGPKLPNIITVRDSLWTYTGEGEEAENTGTAYNLTRTVEITIPAMSGAKDKLEMVAALKNTATSTLLYHPNAVIKDVSDAVRRADTKVAA